MLLWVVESLLLIFHNHAMSKRETKLIPKIVCCRDTNIGMETSRKRVTPIDNRREEQQKRLKSDEQSANTGGVEDYSIETGLDLGVAEQVELLEKRVNSLEEEKRLMIKDIHSLTKKIEACKEEQ